MYSLCIILIGMVTPGKFLVCLYCASSSRSVSVIIRSGLSSEIWAFYYFDLLLYFIFFDGCFIIFYNFSYFAYILVTGWLLFFSGLYWPLFLTDCMFFIKKFFGWLSVMAYSDLFEPLFDSFVVYLLVSMLLSFEICIFNCLAEASENSLFD